MLSEDNEYNETGQLIIVCDSHLTGLPDLTSGDLPQADDSLKLDKLSFLRQCTRPNRALSNPDLLHLSWCLLPRNGYADPFRDSDVMGHFKVDSFFLEPSFCLRMFSEANKYYATGQAMDRNFDNLLGFFYRFSLIHGTMETFLLGP
ncbi:hypothetical protein NL676_025837 [Syzygium grande]|nr:hypothetical protein NL676_025837 [Syzygium grande]